MKRISHGLLAISLTVFAADSMAGDWHQFLGPDRNGISDETNLARSWGSDGPKELWNVQLGEGFGSPCVMGDRVYLLDRVDNAKDVIRAYDISNGDVIWEQSYDAPGRLSYNGSRSTPSVDGERLYAVGAFGEVYCVEQATGKPVWQKSFTNEFGAEPPNWGFSQSPLIYKETLIVAPMSEQTGLVALDLKTGDVKWKSEPIGGNAYTSPAVITIDGVEQIPFHTQGRVTSIDPNTGKTIWSYDGYFNKIPIPDVIKVGDNRLFVGGGYGAGCIVLEVKKNGDSWETKEVGKQPNHGSQIHPFIVHDGHIYANLNTNENLRGDGGDGLACMDLDGNIVWKTGENPPVNRGSLLLADDLILILGGESGKLHLVEANPKEYKELASAQIFTDLQRRDNNIWAPLVLSNGKLLLRNQKEMKCLDVVNP